METYYHPHDLPKFAEMSQGNSELWEKFLSYYSAVFADGAFTEREKGLCRKYCSGGHEGAVAPVWVGITRPESRTIRPQ
jgi:hypothetical protein